MTELIQRILEPTAGVASRLTGLFLWQLNDQSRRLTEDTRGATPEELAWQPAPGMNTIGMLLAHIAIVEVGWINCGMLSRGWDDGDVLPVKRIEVGMPIPAGGQAPAGLEDRDLAFFDAALAKAREFTRRTAAPLTDADLERRFRLPAHWAKDKMFEATLGWVLYHILEHEAGHYGQINLLRHQYRAAREKR